MPGFTPSGDRARILGAIQREARHIRDPHAREVFKRAAVETGLVESNLSNPSGGDADSAGWRQERASLYPNPTNIEASARRFRQEFQKLYTPGEKSYQVAAQVQRPAAQYRGRYQQRAGDAARVLAGLGGDGGQSPGARTATETTTTRTTPGIDNSQARAAAIQQFLGQKGADPVDFALQIRGLQDTPGKTTTSKSMGAAPSSGSGAGARDLVSRANAIDKQRLPYQWGGGHAGKTSISQAVPLDCSGAVSKVLGINPRVASQFKAWGKPGEGGEITVYAKDTHVFAKIRGRDGKWHFFGTSRTNPGGGAGWIPADKISPAYLAGFTVRHA